MFTFILVIILAGCKDNPVQPVPEGIDLIIGEPYLYISTNKTITDSFVIEYSGFVISPEDVLREQIKITFLGKESRSYWWNQYGTDIITPSGNNIHLKAFGYLSVGKITITIQE